ncbi:MULTISPECIES: hypothetical protein [Pectobacterium]|uniref:hypothetical protein n=1 Tax=Pectobacterium TaxID=122277 RepID=UPI001BFFB2E4|nr:MULTISPECIES: hypothetical protein [Pectobacterium]MBT9184818.1 hypothetical protein [Pectobacterium punjabense]MCE9731118.1 hypothetical protein [Pectobacterium sp. IFB5596]GKW10194.1 hypothetical protein PEC301899_04760 [Pectobacterium carotovorum subsp. carotovorum]
MIGIQKTSTTSTVNQLTEAGITKKTKALSTNTQSPSSSIDPDKPNQTSSVSTLARQLSDAAVRAEARDAKSDRSTLAAKARSVDDELVGVNYANNKKTHDAEIPNSDDPERLARAKQATAYNNRQGSNPFRGLSREQLALITYDDSGTFTVNERRAAWSEAYDQEQVWRTMAVAQSKLEWNRGEFKQTEFFKMVLAHHESLPLIEQVQAPEGYVPRLKYMIEMDFNFMTGESGKNADPFKRLFELLSTTKLHLEDGKLTLDTTKDA